MDNIPLSTNVIPFSLPGFQIDEVTKVRDKLIVVARAVGETAICPDCAEPSRHVHSNYVRSPRDLPCGGQVVQLVLHVRRFKCLNTRCTRKTFAERLPAVIPVHAQRTCRLTATLRKVSFELGGEAGARVARRFKIEVSGDTILRIMHRTELDPPETPRVLGIDDWAFRKGQNYGTILVDLERHRPVDLLPDREAETVAAWLQAHPGVEIISRDRANAYIEGATQGAPDAMQIADRWHLLKNLSDTLTRVLTPYRRKLKWLVQPMCSVECSPVDLDRIETEIHSTITKQSHVRREQRYQRYQKVCELHRQGWTFRAIAQEIGLHPKTVSRWIHTECYPELQRSSRCSILDPYKSYLVKRWNEGCRTGAQLCREIRDQGYPGGVTIVTDFVRQLRRVQGLPPGARSLAVQELSTENDRKLTPRRAACLVLKHPDQMKETERELVNRIRQLHSDVEMAVVLAQMFARMIRDQSPDELDSWLEQATNCSVPALRRFAAGVRQDFLAVRAAMVEPWSNGQVEGHVNRLKLIKRQMYGRAKFDLLRLRVLYCDDS